MESVSGSIKNQSNADSLLLYAVSHSPLPPVYIQHECDGSWTISMLKAEQVEEGNFFNHKTFQKFKILCCGLFLLYSNILFSLIFAQCTSCFPLHKMSLCDSFVFSKKHYWKPQPHPLCSSSSRHLREAIRTSPLPELSESGLSLSWRWAKLPQSHRSETAIPSLPRDSLSLIEGIRTGQRARKWPSQRNILYLLALSSSTLP